MAVHTLRSLRNVARHKTLKHSKDNLSDVQSNKDEMITFVVMNILATLCIREKGLYDRQTTGCLKKAGCDEGDDVMLLPI